jgi:dihydrofolate synthase/folylpolyglutamate synthase
MTGFPPPDPVAAALNAHFGPEFGRAFSGDAAYTLEPLQEALARLGDPHRRLPPVIHIAGTNGKGSTAAFAQSVLETAGLKVHAFTQPHLLHTTERLTVASQPISEEAFLALINRVAGPGQSLSHFEAQTACALLAFAETKADAVVLEVGMGGLLDATNVVPNPAVCLITMIGEDHKQALGATLPAIARHKAGIIKPGAHVITAPQDDPAVDRVFEAQAMRTRCPLLMGGVDWTARAEDGNLLIETNAELIQLPLPRLPGAHQRENAALAVLGARALAPDEMSRHPMAVGIVAATWPGRLQRLTQGPLAARAESLGHALSVDGGHNQPAAEALARWMASQMNPVGVIVGMLADKDAVGFLEPFAAQGVSGVVAVQARGPRPAMTQTALAQAAKRVGLRAIARADDLPEAITRAAAFQPRQGRLLITGSLSLVAEALFLSGKTG